MPLQIIIAGAGVAGLSAAIALRRHGHDVTVVERRGKFSDLEQSGSGILLQPNAIRILETWGMMDELKEIAHDNRSSVILQFDDSRILLRDERGGCWYGLRKDIKELLQRVAERHGAKVLQQNGVVQVVVSRPTVVLEDGTHISADLIVGADGSGSRVRRALYPDYKPKILPACCFQAIVPLSTVAKSSSMSKLNLGPENTVHAGPGAAVFSSPCLSGQVYDTQLFDAEYGLEKDPHPDVRNERIYDLEWIRKRFEGWDEGIGQILTQADSLWKWRLVETFGLPSWSSDNGKIVLMGDSCHAMTPFLGEGAAMGIEDAAVLAELLANSFPGDDLRPQLKLYEQIRRPRCEKIQVLSKKIGQLWVARDPKLQKARDRAYQKLKRLPDITGVQPDSEARFGSAEFQSWLDHYDVCKTVEAGLRETNLNRAKL